MYDPNEIARRSWRKRRAEHTEAEREAYLARQREAQKRYRARLRPKLEAEKQTVVISKPSKPSSIERRRLHCPECGERAEVGLGWCERHSDDYQPSPGAVRSLRHYRANRERYSAATRLRMRRIRCQECQERFSIGMDWCARHKS